MKNKDQTPNTSSRDAESAGDLDLVHKSEGRGHAAGFISLGVLLPGALVHVWVTPPRPFVV